MREGTMDRLDLRIPSSQGFIPLDHESYRREFLRHCLQFMEYYDDLGLFVDGWPGVDRSVVIKIVIGQEEDLTLDEALDFLLILVTHHA
jgi:hypothetical protein